MKALKVLIFFVTVFIFCELIALSAPYIYPSEVHQRYLIKDKKEAFYNGRGASGDVYRGQPFRMAIFGASVLRYSDISVGLQERLGHNNIHIDNFSIDLAGLESTLANLKTLKNMGRHYDLLVISHFSRQDFFQFADHFLGRWTVERPFLGLTFFELLTRYVERQKKIDKNLKRFFVLFGKTKKQTKEETIFNLLNHPNYMEVYDHSIREDERIAKNMVYLGPPEFDPERSLAENHIKKIKSLSQEIAKKTYWLKASTFWHPHMLKRYSKDYRMIVQADHFTKENPKFHNDRSLFDYFSFFAETVTNLAEEQEMTVIEVYDKVREHMAVEEGLIGNMFHLSPKGRFYLSEYLSEIIRPLVEEKLKVKINKSGLGRPLKKGDG